ncbi:hypothetical protein OOU_Y34scaffold00648g23 [Pyricularia oryzae Y34]|uniref:Uncharacterized protein n=2 Tax=Pyricularia oryzae TaxID=318829 RepID=A0AA97PJ76_PYRO3|nr:hypothetical protein OOU_Y34scaffold00648g23 [Pyricularia oryzae Y34]
MTYQGRGACSGKYKKETVVPLDD